MRFGPGFEADEQQLDPRLNVESIQALQQSHESERSVVPFYLHFLARMATGDFGVSRSLARPVKELLSSRLPVTFKLMGTGILGGWLLGLAMAFSTVAVRKPLYDFACTAVTTAFLCVPTAVLAVLLFYTNGPARFAIALLIFPKVFRYTRELLADAYAQPHVLAARARGLGSATIVFRHVTPWIAPQLFALAGVSLGVAFGAAIPIEVLCDLPGVGQLAWMAALSRDLPVLVALTILIAVVTQLANAAADVAIAACTRTPV